ncbi:MAG: aspartate ammonia-lyase, partial [Deltaproteobacteria bacterium]|nr:aspartate ammonia-lyase [Deltaproteobacteria bacterium]
RIERDSLGERQVPADAYYGIQTLRALENFPITDIPISNFQSLIRALASVKQAAAMANMGLRLLDGDKGQAIVEACVEVRNGLFDDHFVVDVIQGGAGTSTNMNANEVIANRALERLGHEKGEYEFCHPNNDVNMSQSTNDVYPTTLKIATVWGIDSLLEAMDELRASFAKKGVEFHDVLKLGRTQLQDAVPMTLGQSFEAFSVTLSEDMTRLEEAKLLLYEINLGATAIGTGLNTLEGYSGKACQRLAEITELPLTTSLNLVEATSDVGAFVQLSGVLKRIAVKLSKVCNDLRLLSSGPRAGLNEINLPSVQPGSTIMPGKVNPVIPEVVNQVCFQVIGNDVTISMAAEAGQLELNAFEPVMGFNLFQSIHTLKRAMRVLSGRCVDGITANVDECRTHLERSIGLVTALAPYIGYDDAAALAKEALKTGRTVRELAIERGIYTEDRLDQIMDPDRMTRPSGDPR